MTANNVLNLNETPNAHKHSLNCTKCLRDGRNVSAAAAAAATDDNAEAYRIYTYRRHDRKYCLFLHIFIWSWNSEHRKHFA